MRWPITEDAGERLDVEMHEFAGPGAFIADHRSSGRQMREPIEAHADQDRRDGGARHLQPRGNGPGRLSFVTRGDNGRDGFCRRATRLPMGARGRILERRPPAKAVPPQPFIRGTHADARCGRRLDGRPLVLTDSLNQQRACSVSSWRYDEASLGAPSRTEWNVW